MDVLAASVRTWVERYHVTTPAADHDEPRRVQLAEAFVQQQRAIAEAVYAYAQKRARKMRSRANTNGLNGRPESASSSKNASIRP